MAFSSLTSDEQKQFSERLSIYGLAPKDIEGKSIVTGSGKPGPLVISPSAEHSDVEVIRREVNNVAEMKALGGVPDSHYTTDGIGDHHIDYPPPPAHDPQAVVSQSKGDVCTLLELLGPEHAAHVGAAMHAFLLGNSEKVQAYEPLINALHFPVTGAIAAGESITVTPGNPLVIKGPGPVALNFAVMTIEPGAQVIVETAVTFNIGQLNSNVM